MDDDERLREALLELQLLREKEARTLEETNRLVTCLEAYSEALTPRAALAALFHAIRHTLNATRVMVVQAAGDEGVEIVASDKLSLNSLVFTPPIDLFERPRNFVDIEPLGSWGHPIEEMGAAALLIAPSREDAALMVFRDNGATGFSRNDLDLALRLASLALQAVQSSAISSENTLLAATIAGSSTGFAIADATVDERPLVYVNRAFEEMSGYSAEEVLGKNCRFLMAEEPDAPERIRLRTAVENCKGGTFLLRNQRKSGELFWNELTLFPVGDPDGKGYSLVATQSDVSDRIEAGLDRDRVTARMERALNATEDAFLILEHDRRVAFANASVSVLFPSPGLDWKVGTSFEDNWQVYLDESKDLPGRVTSLLTTPDLDRLANHHSRQEVALPDGRNVLLQAARLDDGGLVISGTDVTAMRSAQNLLGQRLAAIEAATDGIAITDGEGRLIYVNSSASRLLGFASAASALGKRWRGQYDAAGSQDVSGPFEATLSRVGSKGDEVHEIAGSPLEQGGSVIVFRDISDNLVKEAREKGLIRDLIRLQRQEAIAQLTAGVAHDFNNLLSAINGSATLIGMLDDVPPSVEPHVERILAAGQQSAKLINRLLDIGSNTATEGAFELSSTLADLPALVGPSLPATISFDVSTKHTGMVLKGDQGVLSQVIVNLVLNARDAISADTGRVSVTVSKVKGGDVEALAVGSLEGTGEYACLTVCDNGSGMDIDTAARVFQPHFTTKGRHGSGLGLATTAMQVQSVGGAIGLESALGEGTCFSVYWPHSSLSTSVAEDRELPARELTGETIIVVDDDPDVSAVVAAFLEARGAEVAVCDDPRDAATAIQEDPNGWSAMITDYDMPEMNGGELTDHARQVAPMLPIIVVTALARRLTDPRLSNGQASAILAKPVDLEQLYSAVTTAIGVREDKQNAIAAGR